MEYLDLRTNLREHLLEAIQNSVCIGAVCKFGVKCFSIASLFDASLPPIAIE